MNSYSDIDVIEKKVTTKVITPPRQRVKATMQRKKKEPHTAAPHIQFFIKRNQSDEANLRASKRMGTRMMASTWWPPFCGG